ncbi:NTP transferase domain-containing protein [soil metagenome]
MLKPLVGEPMIARQIERLRRSRAITRIVIATSVEASDDPLEAAAAATGVDCHRGPLDDVLARFAGVLERFGDGGAGSVLRLTADCPLADPELIDRVVAGHAATGADLTHVAEGWTFPKGLDVEAVRTAALLTAHAEAIDPEEREHVTPFIHRRPDRFVVRSLTRDPPLRYRWTVDTPEYFAFVEAVYAELYPSDPAFTSEDVLAWQARHPDRVLVNTP